MPADVSKLLSKLRGEYPELRKEPLLDEIESAAYGEEEEMDVMEEDMFDEDMDFEEDMMAEEDAAEEDFEDEEEDEDFAPKKRR